MKPSITREHIVDNGGPRQEVNSWREARELVDARKRANPEEFPYARLVTTRMDCVVPEIETRAVSPWPYDREAQRKVFSRLVDAAAFVLGHGETVRVHDGAHWYEPQFFRPTILSYHLLPKGLIPPMDNIVSTRDARGGSHRGTTIDGYTLHTARSRDGAAREYDLYFPEDQDDAWKRSCHSRILRKDGYWHQLATFVEFVDADRREETLTVMRFREDIVSDHLIDMHTHWPGAGWRSPLYLYGNDREHATFDKIDAHFKAHEPPLPLAPGSPG